MKNNRYKILVVEDEPNINEFVCTLLEAGGYQVVPADSGKNARLLYNSHRPDLMILDLGLPDMDGMCVLEYVRERSLTPIIVLSARDGERDKVKALNMGANDYITKPFGSEEFVARVRTALRVTSHRSDDGKYPGGKFETGGLVIDYDARTVSVDGAEVRLTQTEYNIVALLSEHVGKMLTYDFIIHEIWGYNDTGSIKKLQVNMANIRKKLGDKPGKKNYIINELGVGYRM